MLTSKNWLVKVFSYSDDGDCSVIFMLMLMLVEDDLKCEERGEKGEQKGKKKKGPL